MLYDRLLQEASVQRAAGINGVQEALLGFDDLPGALPFLLDSGLADLRPHNAAYPAEFPKIFVNFTRPLEIEWNPDALLTDGSRCGVAQRRFGGILIRQKDAEILGAGEKTTKTRAYACTWFEEPAEYVDNFTLIFHKEAFPYFANRGRHRQMGTYAQADTLHNAALNLMYFLDTERDKVEVMDPKTPDGQKMMRATGQYTARQFYAVPGRGINLNGENKR